MEKKRGKEIHKNQRSEKFTDSLQCSSLINFFLFYVWLWLCILSIMILGQYLRKFWNMRFCEKRVCFLLETLCKTTSGVDGE